MTAAVYAEDGTGICSVWREFICCNTPFPYNYLLNKNICIHYYTECRLNSMQLPDQIHITIDTSHKHCRWEVWKAERELAHLHFTSPLSYKHWKLSQWNTASTIQDVFSRTSSSLMRGCMNILCFLLYKYRKLDDQSQQHFQDRGENLLVRLLLHYPAVEL